MVSSAVACGFQADPAKYDTEQRGSGRAWHSTVAYPGFYKKLCCSGQTAPRNVRVKIFPTAAQQLYKKSRTNGSNGSYRVTVNHGVINFVHPALTRSTVRRRRDAQAPESTTFVDHTIDLLWRNFLNPEFGAKFQREVPGTIIFGRTWISLKHSLG